MDVVAAAAFQSSFRWAAAAVAGVAVDLVAVVEALVASVGEEDSPVVEEVLPGEHCPGQRLRLESEFASRAFTENRLWQ